jgi:beta-lactamase regulating signal transducer with metallopeptidase domain/DUF4097 and DUF4098 domain-containing protein YvlB
MIQSGNVILGPAALAGLVLKVTMLIGAGAALVAGLQRHSAATRHFVWFIALAGALALVVLAPIAPRLPVPVPLSLAPAAFPQPTPAAPAASGPASVAAARPDATPRGGPASPGSPVRGRPVAVALVAVWIAGCAAVIAWSLLGHFGLARLDRAATPIEPTVWEGLPGVPEPAGVGGRVRLGLSPSIGTPLTWGWPRSVILLPEEAERWPDERRRVALLHELAHVARRDYLAQAVATAACAVYWFHPLVWFAARKLRAESEHACDDRVLAWGMPATEYASTLLEVARGARALRRVGFVAAAMARRSHLEGRLLAVLDESRPRGGLPRRIGVGVAAATGLLLIPIAGLAPHVVAFAAPVMSAAAAASSSAARTSGASDRRGGEARDGSTFERDVPASPGEALVIEVETGATVVIRGSDRPTVHVLGRLRGRDWRDTRAVVERTSSGVRLSTQQESRSWSYSTSHHFEIDVPRRFDVRLRSAGGAVRIENVEGNFRGETGGGEIVLAHLQGQASLSTGGGNIEVSDSNLGGRVSTGGGTVQFSRVRGGLRGASGGGPVIYRDGEGATRDRGTGDVRVMGPAGDADEPGRSQAKGNDADTRGAGFLHMKSAGGEIDLDDASEGGDFSTGGGDVRIGRAGGPVSASTGGGTVRIGGVEGSVTAHTGGGDMEIGPVTGSVLATTGAGDVRVTLAGAGGRTRNVEISSGSGSVTVELPDRPDLRIEVETAYTRNFHRATTIESAWSLDREETTEWDSSRGSPRRYVRAHGTLGNGQGLLRIHTVNGNIQLVKAGR